MTPGTCDRSRARRELLAALVVQLALIALFLGKPILRFGTLHYTPADLTQGMSLTRLEPGHVPGNQLQSDAITQMQPWALFNRSELAQGRFPLWNPHNGAGCPHFANYQSAVCSPFTLPFYVLPFKLALLVSAALKLICLSAFTYLFLRAIGCGWLAANVGAAAFGFAGHNALLLYFPHVGAVAALPAGLYFAERALRAVEEALDAPGTRTPARLLAACAGLTASLVVGLLAGNPEPFYFSCWGIAAWCAARLAGLWSAHRRDAWARRALLRAGGTLLFAALLAAGLAAFQLLPFFEYLRSSHVLELRSHDQTPLETRWWPLLVFPDILGSPAGPYRISENVPPPNYELVNMSYLGGAALLLGLAAPLLAPRRRGALFFPLLAVVWYAHAHDVGGVSELFELVPTVDLAPVNRSQALWSFALSAAAAIGLDAVLVRGPVRAWFGAWWTLAAATAAVVAALVGADRLIGEFSQVPSPNHARFLSFVPAHVACMALWTLAGAAAVALLLVVRARRVRLLLGVLLGVAVFAQGGWLLRNYNPSSRDELVFPLTPPIRTLQEIAGTERIAILGQDGLPPDSNLVYGLSQLASYDGLWVAAADLLHRDQFGDGGNWRPILKGTRRGLRLFGTRWVLAKWGWNFIDSAGVSQGLLPGQALERVELLPGQAAVQEFRCQLPGLTTVQVTLSTPASVRDCTLRFRLEEAASGRIVSEQALSSAAVQATVHSHRHVTWPGEPVLDPPGRPVVFRFDPELGSSGREYRIVLACEDGRPADTIFAWHVPSPTKRQGIARLGQRKLAGELLCDWSFGEDHHFETTAELGEYTLFRLRDPAPTYTVAEAGTVLPGREEQFGLVLTPAFDPRRIVALDPHDQATRSAAERALESARRRRIVAFTDAPHCYFVGEDGRTLLKIRDDVVFLANGFAWSQIESLPSERKAEFTLLAEPDPATQLAHGLRPIAALRRGVSQPEVLEETPTRIRLRVERDRPGYLVAANAWDPGWKARLGGTEVPLLRANYAFQAVELPAGLSEVELRYWPDSLTRGLWITCANLLVAAGALLRGARSALRAGRAGTILPS